MFKGLPRGNQGNTLLWPLPLAPPTLTFIATVRLKSLTACERWQNRLYSAGKPWQPHGSFLGLGRVHPCSSGRPLTTVDHLKVDRVPL